MRVFGFIILGIFIKIHPRVGNCTDFGVDFDLDLSAICRGRNLLRP